jgi:hypothetical protein
VQRFQGSDWKFANSETLESRGQLVIQRLREEGAAGSPFSFCCGRHMLPPQRSAMLAASLVILCNPLIFIMNKLLP